MTPTYRPTCCFLQAIRGISILKRAIVKIQLSPSQLTSIHADLCQVMNIVWSFPEK